ncbi:Integrase catalytic domain-containing protein [Aphis craccivora]|uniref:Integrase catalytic domain-containing protein n=1 Tax=Aphis craccivora TaxID=307492 RepID=A0A6G0VY90_APHCR|nr:Integrase catalytic domain-containing protein [Aphis craccivora]
MAHVDVLSRTTEGAGATSEPMDTIFEGRYEVCLTVNQIDRIRFMQQGDTTITKLGKLLIESTPSNKTQDRIRDYELIGGLVYRKCGPKNCLIHKRPGGRRPGLLHPISPGHRPFAANGHVERVNRTLIPILSITSIEQCRWDQKLTEIEQNLNTAYNKATKKTPYETVYGYYPNFRGGAERQLNLNRNQWTPSHKVQAEAKYRSRPLQVVEVLPSDTYRVVEISLDGQTTYTTTAHVSQLKSWRVLNVDESEEEDTVEGVEQEEDQGVVADPLPIPSTQSAGSEPLNLPRRSARERRGPPT